VNTIVDADVPVSKVFQQRSLQDSNDIDRAEYAQLDLNARTFCEVAKSKNISGFTAIYYTYSLMFNAMSVRVQLRHVVLYTYS
jgi:hypothetical protein